MGIPQSVGKEFANADPGGKLPEKAKDVGAVDMVKSKFKQLGNLLTEFFKEEAEEPEHEAEDEEPDKVESKEQAEKEDEDDQPKGRAASIAFVTQDGRMLFVKRAKDEKNFPGHWSLLAAN